MYLRFAIIVPVLAFACGGRSTLDGGTLSAAAGSPVFATGGVLNAAGAGGISGASIGGAPVNTGGRAGDSGVSGGLASGGTTGGRAGQGGSGGAMAGSSGFGGHHAVECTDPLTFPDRALEANVRLNINRPSGDIHPSDVAMLADLAASGGDVRGQIRDLSGIECLTGLVYVRLNDNQIGDLGPLAALSSCRLLNLANNTVIADVTPLASLARLNSLDVSGNRLANVAPLGGLAELKELDVSRNQVSDLGPLGKLGQLHTLNLNFNPIANFSALGSLLPHLDDLSLTSTGLSGLALLVGPPGLRCGGTLSVFNDPFDCSAEAKNLKLLRQRCDYVGTDCP